MSQERIDAIVALKKPTHKVARNPIFDAVVAKEKHLLSVNSSSRLPMVSSVPSDESFAAAARSFLGLRKPKDLKAKIQACRKPRALLGPVAPLPKTYDSRTLNLVPPIKNQASCGSCWDFSGIGTAEIAFCKAFGIDPKTVSWSEQAIIDCFPTGGCSGDFPSTVFENLKATGTCDTGDDMYRASDSNGRCPSKKPHKIDDFGYCGSQEGVASSDSIKQRIVENGSASVCVAVDDSWMAYAGGIFDGNYTEVNHAVIAVGWGVDSNSGREYWIIRNHWGADWGEDGYIRQYFGSNQIGDTAMYCVIKGTAPNPSPPSPPVPPSPPIPVQLVGFDMAGVKVTFLGVPHGDFGKKADLTGTLAGIAVPIYGPTGCRVAVFSSKSEMLQARKVATISWLHLLWDVQKLVADLATTDVPGTVAMAKQLIADLKAGNFSAVITVDLPALEAKIAQGAWESALPDIVQILADLGINVSL